MSVGSRWKRVIKVSKTSQLFTIGRRFGPMTCLAKLMVVMKSLPNWGVAAKRKKRTSVADLPAEPKGPNSSMLSVEGDRIRVELHGSDA
jgi:hypothetical protein